jgi:predicted nuclease of predicted toxin-antitoxin system
VKLLFDENLSPAQVQLARELGHDAVSVLESGLSGRSDDVVRAYAISEGRALVTLDADFSNIFRFPPQGTAGVIRLRVFPPTEAAISALLRWALLRLKEVPLNNKLAVVEPNRIRIR